MNDQADTDRTAALLRAALTAAADVMVVSDVPERQYGNEDQAYSPGSRKRASHIWAPLAAAALVVVIAVGTVIGAHLTSPSGPPPAQSQSRAQGATGTTAQPPRRAFYLTARGPAFGQNVLQFQVRRTNGGAVTDERTIHAANVGWGGYLAAGAGDSTFYIAPDDCSTAPTSYTTFDRITITSAGRITSLAPASPPVKGLVIDFAVSPSGSQVAYKAMTGNCNGGGHAWPSLSAVSVENLSSGAGPGRTHGRRAKTADCRGRRTAARSSSTKLRSASST